MRMSLPVEKPCYIELENGNVLFEQTIAPHGTGGANLMLYSVKEFKERVDDPEVDVRPVNKIDRNK